MRSLVFQATILSLLSFATNSAFAKNLHPIDPPEGKSQVAKTAPGENVNPNFGIFRTGRPLSAAEFDDMVCGPEGHPDQAISEIWVLSDKFGSDEKKYNDPKSEIWQRPENKNYKRRCDKTITVQNFNQSVKDSPLSKEFLAKFDKYVKDARRDGRKIAFRCDCGCHRTGRLAAYYEMAYMGHSVDEAMKNMTKYAHGKPDAVGRAVYWWLIKHKLKKQTEALYDYVHGKKCSTRSKFCVVDDEATAQVRIGKNGEDYDDMTTEELIAAAKAEGYVENDGESKDISRDAVVRSGEAPAKRFESTEVK